MNSEIFSKANILFDNESTTQDESFKKIAQFVAQQGYSDSPDSFYVGFKELFFFQFVGFFVCLFVCLFACCTFFPHKSVENLSTSENDFILLLSDFQE